MSCLRSCSQTDTTPENHPVRISGMILASGSAREAQHHRLPALHSPPKIDTYITVVQPVHSLVLSRFRPAAIYLLQHSGDSVVVLAFHS